MTRTGSALPPTLQWSIIASNTMTLAAGLSLTVGACRGVEPGLENPGDRRQLAE
jgi:hypothetical protein